jgi:hypothetical protein
MSRTGTVKSSGEFGKVKRFEESEPRPLDIGDKRGLLHIPSVYLFGPDSTDDIADPIQFRFIDHESRIDGRGIGDDAESQAGRPPSIRHRLADIDHLD